MGVLRLHRRPPPSLAVFGLRWAEWIGTAAEAAACALDDVVAALIAAVSALIGHAR